MPATCYPNLDIKINFLEIPMVKEEICYSIKIAFASAITAIITLLIIVSLSSCSKSTNSTSNNPKGWHLVWNDEFNSFWHTFDFEFFSGDDFTIDRNVDIFTI